MKLKRNDLSGLIKEAVVLTEVEKQITHNVDIQNPATGWHDWCVESLGLLQCVCL